MAKLKNVPQFLLDMTNEELMEWNLEDEYDENDNLIRPGMITCAINWGCIDELEALLDATSTKKRYPRVLKPSKKIPGKMTWQADKTQPKYEQVSPVGFFEVKAKFIHEVCGLPSLKKPAEPDFRAKIRAAAAGARAGKAAAAADKEAEYAAIADAKIAEMKAANKKA